MFTDFLDRGTLINPDGICIVNHDGSGALSHREFSRLTHRIALGLKAQGVRPGSRVSILSPNSPIAFACAIGIMRAGAGWVALNPKSKPSELRDLLSLVSCDYLFVHESFRDRGAELLQSTCIWGSVQFTDDPAHGEFVAWLGPEGADMDRLPYDPNSATMVLGTGGTTGAPKAVPLTARMLREMCLAFETHAPEPEPSVYIVATPMTHAAGATGFPTISHGGTIVVHDGVKPDVILDSIERNRVTRLFLPPTAIYALLAEPGVRSRDYSSLRHFIYASAPMSADKLAEAIEVFGPVMTQTYGQSEAPMICTVMTPEEHAQAVSNPSLRHRLGSCGRPSAVVALEIMDDDGNLLSNDERGEIVVRGDLVMNGYENNPEATAGAQRPGGWLGTADIGYRDGDGYVYIVDRKRDMIISGGFNVFPSQVERVLWSHESVLDCAVIGVPDEKWGEAVTAAVELKDGCDATEEELIALCKQELGSVQAPKRIIFRELPRSLNGKVLKRVLRDDYWVGKERMV